MILPFFFDLETDQIFDLQIKLSQYQSFVEYLVSNIISNKLSWIILVTYLAIQFFKIKLKYLWAIRVCYFVYNPLLKAENMSWIVSTA